jgi:hypothetical protein
MTRTPCSAAALAIALSCATPCLAQNQPQSEAKGPASTYIIQIKKFELCQDVDNTGGGCAGPFVVGSGTKSFDIASASVGAAVGSYASNVVFPAGVTYKYIRFTLSRTFTIAGVVQNVFNVAGGTTCRTGGADATGFTLATAGIGLVGGGTAAPQVLKIPNTGAWDGTYPNYPTSITSTSPAVSIADNAPDFAVTWPLTKPFTVTSSTPVITIAFDTQHALGAGSTLASNGQCSLNPQPPQISITVQ